MTEEDLLKLDETLQQVTLRRASYPPRLRIYLEKILEHQAAVAKGVEGRWSPRPFDFEDDDLCFEPERLAENKTLIGRGGEALLVLGKEESRKTDRLAAAAQGTLDVAQLYHGRETGQ